jgi:hypothetical protein
MGVADDLAKLAQLHYDGVLTDQEFYDAKNAVLYPGDRNPADRDLDELDPAREYFERQNRWMDARIAWNIVVVSAIIVVVVIATSQGWF